MFLTFPTLSDAERTVLTVRLSEAETARHELLTSQNVQRLRHGDRDISFGASDINKLDAYINELRGQLGLPLMQISRTMWRRPRWAM